MLPSLREVRLEKPIAMDGPSWDSLQSSITARSISGRPVEATAPSYQCHICHGGFEEQQKLKLHLRNNHGYQILCAYCGEFECTPGRRDLLVFRKHLKNKHPEITHGDSLRSKPSLTRHGLRNLVNPHSSLRAPDVVPPSEFTNLHYQIAMESDDWIYDSDDGWSITAVYT